MKLGRLIDAARAPLWQWAEMLALTLLAMLLAHAASPGQVFASPGGFPWVWLAPVLLALRYGVVIGVGSAALLVAGWGLGQQLGLILPGAFPKLQFLGGLILTMVCGEFSGAWGVRLRRAEELNRYLDGRIEQLAQKFYLLRISHDRLEQNLLSRPSTLRDAMLELRRLMAAQGAGTVLPGAAEFLGLLSRHAQLTRAAIYRRAGNGFEAEPLAAVGGQRTLAADDPLLAYALNHHQLAHVNLAALRGANPSRYLVVIPIRNAGGGAAGAIAVEQMPFFALNDEALQALAALAGYYADSAIVSGSGCQILAVWPDCPPEFADNLVRLAHIAHDAGIPSSIAMLVFPDDARGREWCDAIRRMRRELDLDWKYERTGTLALLTLMPLSAEAATEGYFARLEGWFKHHAGADFAHSGIRTLSAPLTDIDCTRQLRALLERADAHAPTTQRFSP
jgi:hypothetical protein